MRARETPDAAPDGLSYLDFYRDRYAPVIQEARVFEGRDAIEMFQVDQPSGHYPDAPVDTYTVQLLEHDRVELEADAGAGRFNTTMRAGDIAIAPPGVASDWTTLGRSRLLMLGLPPDVVRQASEALGVDRFDPEPLMRGVRTDEPTRQLLSWCWHEMRASSLPDSLRIDSTALAIASRLVALAHGPDRAREPVVALEPRWLNRIEEYVDSGIDDELRVGTLARLVGLSEQQFTRAFVAATGKPPWRWVIDRRLDRAREMLARDSMRIVDIALATGFTGQSHFTRAFSQRFGTTPAAFRRSLR